MTLLRHRADAEDVVHDCFVRLLAKRKTYDLVRDGDKLLFKSVTHACINQTQRRRASVDWREIGDSIAGSPPGIGTPVESPLQQAIARELEDAVKNALQTLPVLQRAAVELHSWGYMTDEVAEILDVSADNARMLLHRGRKALIARLQPFLEEHQQ